MIASNRAIRATFVMEQHLGHRAFYQNLRTSLHNMARLDARWVEITYDQSDAPWKTWTWMPAQVRGALSGRVQVRQGLGKGSQDVVFFNTQAPAVLGGSLLRTQPYIICTDITPKQYDRMGEYYGHQADRPGLLSSYKHWRNVRLLRRAACVLPWSNWVRHSLITEYGVAPEKIKVIPPGVDTQWWQPRPPQAPSDKVRILFVGGDFQRKGGELLLQAFRALPAGSAELVLVTRTPVHEGDGVIVRTDLRPNSPELLELYQSSDLFVLPTQAEAFGIAAVEAGAVGLPVIATNVGGVSDIVIDGVTGILLERPDVTLLSANLQQLLTASAWRQQLGIQARTHVERHFDAQTNAARIFAIIEEIVAR
ncbi:MAG: glycosyltransferase family 4 protein [Caldilineaceae bacterium]